MGIVRPDHPAPPLPPPDYANRVLGCLLGGAVGDAFGYEVEFMRLPEIRRRFGPQGMTEPVRHGGALAVSDDTQMTLFTLEALLRAQAAGCLARCGGGPGDLGGGAGLRG